MAVPPERRKGTFVKGQATRRAFMQAAQAVFAREGFLRAEIGQIVEEAGKGKGTFYLYFESKNKLLAAMAEAFADDVRGPGMLRVPTNPPEEIRAVLRVIWTIFKRHAATFRAMADAALLFPEFSDIYRDIRSYAGRDFASMIRARQASGYCLRLDADMAASALEKLVNASLYEWLASPRDSASPKLDEDRAFESLVAIMQAVLELPSEQTRALWERVRDSD